MVRSYVLFLDSPFTKAYTILDKRICNFSPAFVANARPGFCKKRTRILVPAEQGNRVRIPDTERSQPIGFAGSESDRRAIRAGPGGRLPKVAVFLKHCFPYGVIRAR